MKKRFLSILITFCMLFTLLPMAAMAADNDFVIENGVLTKYKGNGGHVSIPNSVTEIGDGAFRCCYNLSSVSIPDSVTKIGDAVFSACYNLTSVSIPESVTKISNGAFSECSNLTSVSIPDSVTEIGKWAFRCCYNLSSVSIPDSVTKIGDEAFYHCDSLTNVSIPDSVTKIGSGVFEACKNLSSVSIPNSVTEISAGMFSFCYNLSNVSIPDSVTKIGGSAFMYCESLTSVCIPDSVTEIGAYIFTGCVNLTSVSIPDSVTEIGVAAFSDCDNLTAIYYEGTQEQWAAINPTDYRDKMHFGSASPTPPSSWAVELVNEAIAADIVPANLQSKYTANTTRAEFCALAVKLYEKATGTKATGRVTFTDTTDPNVEKAVYLGIASGVGDGKFNPSGALTREQAAVMLSQLADALGMPLPEAQPDFADNAAMSSWAKPFVGKVKAAGIMSGVGDNKFDPAAKYTREQSIITALKLFRIS